MKFIIILFGLIITETCLSQGIKLSVINLKKLHHEPVWPHAFQQRIVTQTLNHDTITVIIGDIIGCMGINEVNSYKNMDTLKLYYSEAIRWIDTMPNGEIHHMSKSSTRDCYFEYSFDIKGLTNIPTVITVNDSVIKYYPDKYKIFPVRFNIVGTDTVNYVDKFGRKQGKWLNPKYIREYNSRDSFYFIGQYYNNRIKSYEYRIYNKSGQLIYVKMQTDYNSYNETDYFENGSIKEQYIQNGDKNRMHNEYYSNGVLKFVHIDNDSFNEVTVYYNNGKLKEINNNLICREFYENGQLKKELFYARHTDKIWAKYYYSSGSLMAIEYKKDKKRKTGIVIRHKWKCYDISGKRVPRDFLIKKGYIILKG